MDTPKFIAAVIDCKKPETIATALGDEYGAVHNAGLNNFVDAASAEATKRLDLSWDVYKRVGRSTPNKSWAVTFVCFYDYEVKQKIVHNCVDWKEALKSAFPREVADGDDGWLDTELMEDALTNAADMDCGFSCIEIDELAL